MPQLLLIKEANTDQKKVGDIVGVFNDAHKFTPYEQMIYYIEYVAGFSSALDLKRSLPIPERKTIYRMSHTDWSFDPPEESEVWKDTDGKWYCYDRPQKFKLNYYALSSDDRRALALEEISKEERIELLAKCENRIKSHPENLIEKSDLSTISR